MTKKLTASAAIDLLMKLAEAANKRLILPKPSRLSSQAKQAYDHIKNNDFGCAEDAVLKLVSIILGEDISQPKNVNLDFTKYQAFIYGQRLFIVVAITVDADVEVCSPNSAPGHNYYCNNQTSMSSMVIGDRMKPVITKEHSKIMKRALLTNVDWIREHFPELRTIAAIK